MVMLVKQISDMNISQKTQVFVIYLKCLTRKLLSSDDKSIYPKYMLNFKGQK